MDSDTDDPLSTNSSGVSSKPRSGPETRRFRLWGIKSLLYLDLNFELNLNFDKELGLYLVRNLHLKEVHFELELEWKLNLEQDLEQDLE